MNKHELKITIDTKSSRNGKVELERFMDDEV